MLISVIIPAYNRGADIATAVHSVLEQDYRNLELIVVDDCSRDNTAEVVERISDSRIRLLRRDTNGGASAARNTGIAAASGELIAFLDSDDSWLPSKLSRNVAFTLARNLTLSSRWLAYNRVQVRTEFGSRASQPARPGSTVAEMLFCNQGFIQTSAIFLPAFLAKETRFAEDVAWVDDWEFVIRLNRAGASLEFQDEVLTVHNAFSRATRMSNRGNAEHLIRWIEHHRDSFSPKERAGFYATRVAPQLIIAGDRMGALRMLAEGVAANAVAPRTVAVEVARATTSGSVFDRLRRLLAHSKRRGR